MLAIVTAGTLLGVDAQPVAVEVHLAYGMQAFKTVGLPDGAVREARVRVKSALVNTGLEWPVRNITVNLAPADLRKDGTLYDLPIAVALLASSGQIAERGDDWTLADFMLIGELSLSGDVRPVRGVLPLAICAKERGVKALLLPAANAREASVVQGLKVLPVKHLSEVVEFFRGEGELQEALSPSAEQPSAHTSPLDFAEVRGQEQAKRALVVAAAGGHNVLMLGPPGSGKTMLARRIPTILPQMSFEEALETTRIYSVTGLLGEEVGLMRHRPFRAPHHTISSVGLVGGGHGLPRPGEISLAHNGVLFLDELPEFQKHALEVLRQPLEDQQVTISRSLMTLTYPAAVTLIASMNPCPCGYAGDPDKACVCAPAQVERYRARLSGPLLDRIDIHVEVPSVRYKDLSDARKGEPSATLRAKVERARNRQAARLKGMGVHNNAQMQARHLERFCQVDADGHRLLERVVDKLGMSARAYARILKVARTIADLADEDTIQTPHLAEAIQYRVLDRQQRP